MDCHSLDDVGHLHATAQPWIERRDQDRRKIRAHTPLWAISRESKLYSGYLVIDKAHRMQIISGQREVQLRNNQHLGTPVIAILPSA